MKRKRVCVYCSASDGISEIYFRAAQDVGRMLGENGYDLVYGGSDFGLMGAVSQSAKQNGSHVCGVMPKKLYEMINKNTGNCDEFILTENMRDRKEKMDEYSDAVIALAGGFGTLDEVIEIIDLKILGYNTKPIIFLNTNGFYDKLFDFFGQIVNENFAIEKSVKMFYLAQTSKDAAMYLKNYTPNEMPKTVEDIYIK